MSAPIVGVVGASARAAVMSLARAGFEAWAVDLFNDRDLKRIAPCARCPFADFPQAMPQLAERFPSGPVLYAGGLENYPEIVRELMLRRPLWGNGPEVIERVRNPFKLASRLRQQPELLAAGETIPEPDAPARDWLIKSLRSSGGLGVRSAIPGETIPQGHYAQQFVEGTSMSAVFFGQQMLGVTEQLIGTPWLHAKPFHYAGTIHEPDAQARVDGDPLLARRARIQQIGESLRQAFGLIGYFGIDFILKDGTPSVVEVNPRYPASVEVLEHAAHLDRAVGKAIYFAPHAFLFPQSGPWDADLDVPFDPWRLPGFADIPEPDEPMEAGSPVLTFFASGSTAASCRDQLQSRAAELDILFARTA